MAKWNNLVAGDKASETEVFSGGASNYIAADGTKQRNRSRDLLNAWLNEQSYRFYDPQIHPDTHGRDYNYDIDGPAEKTARKAARVRIYVIGDETIAAVTADEIRQDVAAGLPMVVWFCGALDQKRRPVFLPQGMNNQVYVRKMFGQVEIPQDPAVLEHLKEYKKAGDRLRAELVDFLKEHPEASVTYDLAGVKYAVRHKMEAAHQTA